MKKSRFTETEFVYAVKQADPYVSLAVQAHRKPRENMRAVMIERLAERSCDMPWHRIRRRLDSLQITKFFHLNQRVHLRNEITAEARNILKKPDITPPRQLIYLENTPKKWPKSVDTR